jgi:hypothetical protein
VITCVIRYEIDPHKIEAFNHYLIGYFAPHEGSSTLAYGIYTIESLAAYEQYRARLSTDETGRANYEFARKEQFIRQETRTFHRLTSAPHGKLVRR